MSWQFVDDNIQSFTREHPELMKALEQYYDEQNITLSKLGKIVDGDIDKKPSQAYQAFCQQIGQQIVQQQNRILSLIMTTAMARVLERKQESIIAIANPVDADIPHDIKSLASKRYGDGGKRHNQT